MVGKRASKKCKLDSEEETQMNKKSNLVNESDKDENDDDEAHPIGDVIRVSNDGDLVKNHYNGFDFDGNSYHLEDTILVAPEEGKYKPSVAIIKDIFQTEDGSLTVSAQRFYRPEEAEKNGGGYWESRDARELFYSHQLDEFSAYNVMHKCVIHVVPLHKPLPDRKKQPGFVVSKCYDYARKKVRNLTDKDCNDVLPQPPTS